MPSDHPKTPPKCPHFVTNEHGTYFRFPDPNGFNGVMIQMRLDLIPVATRPVPSSLAIEYWKRYCDKKNNAKASLKTDKKVAEWREWGWPK